MNKNKTIEEIMDELKKKGEIKIKLVDISKMWIPLLLVAAAGIIGAVTVFGNEKAFMLVMVYIGALCCIPAGLVLGMIVGNQYMRCKIMRKLRNKNYGIVHMVGRGKRITSRIKNFDNDLIWIDDKVWILYDQKVYSIDDDNPFSPIESEHVHMIAGDVPAIFLSLDSMVPLSFQQQPTAIMPEQLGASILGYVNNQLEKQRFFRKTLQTIQLVLIFLVVIALYFSFMNNTVLNNDVLPMLEQLKNQTHNLLTP